VAFVLATSTACLEHIEALTTQVRYDPYRQVFEVEQRLVGVEKRFLGCEALEDCLAAIERAMSLQPNSSVSLALGDRLLQRLLESGAAEVQLGLERHDDSLDAIVRYEAPVGSAAADNTLVRAEWKGGRKRGHYYLVVLAQASMEPPRWYRTRKIARSGPAGVDWVEEWLLPRWVREITTTMTVGEANPLLAEVPGLGEALESHGWLGPLPERQERDNDEPEPDEDEPEPDVASAEDTGIVPGYEEVEDPDGDGQVSLGDAEEPPVEAPARPNRKSQSQSGEVTSVALDPTSPAKTWLYPARISGGSLTPAAAAVALEPLVPAISRCYQSRQREVSNLEGSVFLSALVRADGAVLATSVNGALGDPVLLNCLDRVIDSWTFASWGAGEEVSDVAVPVVFRLEKGGPGR
jgi:hypothetical protein